MALTLSAVSSLNQSGASTSTSLPIERISCWKAEGEDAVFVSTLDLPLGLMQGEAAQIVGLSCRHLELDSLDIDILSSDDAKTVLEIVFAVEILGISIGSLPYLFRF